MLRCWIGREKRLNEYCSWHSSASRHSFFSLRGFFNSYIFSLSFSSHQICDFFSQHTDHQTRNMNSLSDRFKNALGKGRKASTTERSDLENPTLANIQSDSLFIRKLPYDIRRIIYDDLLQSLAGTLHVNFHPNKAENRYDKRPMHTHCQVCLCKNPGESSDIAYEDCCNGFWTGDHLACGEDAKHHTHCKKSTRNYRTHRPEFLYLQSLLLTCRAV